MTRWNAFRTVSALVVAGLVLGGCASPPEAEKKAAESAVAAAKQAGADKYAAQAYAAMDAAQKQADSQMTAKEYKEAKVSYEKVKSLADEAAKAAASGKAALQAEVQKAVTELETRWTALQASAQAATKKLKPEVKKAWDEGSAKVAETLKAAKNAAATEPTAAKEKLAEVGAAIEKWTADLAAAAMPAAPAGKPVAGKATAPQVKKQ